MQRAALAIAVLIGSGLVVSTPAAPALGDPMSQRATHWSIGGGGGLAITGSESRFSLADAELYPGGRLGRLGARVEGRGLGRDAPNVILAGVSFEAATSRPRLVLALYASVGATFEGQPSAAAGIQTQLFIVGPLALGLDASALLVIDGSQDTELILGSALTLRLGR